MLQWNNIITQFGLDHTKKEPSIFLKIQSKHRQVTSSKFPKRFRGACDLVELGEFLKVPITPKKSQKKS